MLVLAIDTALAGCTAGLWNTEDGGCVYERKPMMRGQSEELVPMIQRVMAQAGYDFSAIGLIAATVGPGAFTGIRIGLAAAQGLSLALDCPLCGVTTTESIAADWFRNNTERTAMLAVLLETRRQDFYCQFFAPDGAEISTPNAWSAEKITDFLSGKKNVLIGDGVPRYRQEQGTDSYALPLPATIAALGYEQFLAGCQRPAQPLYLREADVSISKKEQRIIREE